MKQRGFSTRGKLRARGGILRSAVLPKRSEAVAETLLLETLFVRHRAIAGGLASQLSEKFNLPREEVREEAESLLAMLLCDQWWSFDPELSEWSTWIYGRLHGLLWNWCVRECERRMYSIDEMEEAQREIRLHQGTRVVAELTIERGWLETLWSELGNEGRMLLRVIFEAPGVLSDELWSVKRGGGVRLRVNDSKKGNERKRRAVLRFLVAEQWPREQIERAWRQVEECCHG